MKTIALLFAIVFNCTFSFCQDSDGIWKSTSADLQLKFSKPWEFITPYSDTDSKVLAGLMDKTDNSSFIVKITNDVSKEQLSDEAYNNAIKEQMLKANPINKLLIQDEIDFKGKKYTRLVFSMKTKYGDFISTNYINRNGKKMIGIQFSYPNNQTNEIPLKIQKVLSEMKI